MLSKEHIKALSVKYQTLEINIWREYIQNLFLSILYQQKNSDKLFFKGGTALRLIHQSPRFSEDLDFTGQDLKLSEIDDLFITVLSKMESAGLKAKLNEAKPTSGGYWGEAIFGLDGFTSRIEINISLRKKDTLKGNVITVVQDYLPAYPVLVLPPEALVEEKLMALKTRQKPRDYYDLYFILRHPGLRNYISSIRLTEIAKLIAKQPLDFKRDLAPLLPKSHHMVLKNLKNAILSELTAYH